MSRANKQWSWGVLREKRKIALSLLSTTFKFRHHCQCASMAAGQAVVDLNALLEMLCQLLTWYTLQSVILWWRFSKSKGGIGLSIKIQDVFGHGQGLSAVLAWLNQCRWSHYVSHQFKMSKLTGCRPCGYILKCIPYLLDVCELCGSLARRFSPAM